MDGTIKRKAMAGEPAQLGRVLAAQSTSSFGAVSECTDSCQYSRDGVCDKPRQLGHLEPIAPIVVCGTSSGKSNL